MNDFFVKDTLESRPISSHFPLDLLPCLQNHFLVDIFFLKGCLDLSLFFPELTLIELDRSLQVEGNGIKELLGLIGWIDFIEVPSICSVAEIFQTKLGSLYILKLEQRLLQIMSVSARKSPKNLHTQIDQPIPFSRQSVKQVERLPQNTKDLGFIQNYKSSIPPSISTILRRLILHNYIPINSHRNRLCSSYYTAPRLIYCQIRYVLKAGCDMRASGCDWPVAKYNAQNNNLPMAFLDKFKGKTQLLSKDEVSGILGKGTTHQNTTKIQTSATFSPQQHKTHQSQYQTNKDPGKNKQQSSAALKSTKVSPYHVFNPFYLDELQKQKAQRERHERDVKERLERERKKREEIQARLAESGKINKDKFQNKQWVPMGGLGPNIGGQQWQKKTQLHQKMLKFSSQIKKINLQKLRCVPFMSVSHLQNGTKKDSRSLGIEYSRGVPRPNILAAEKMLAGIPRSQSKEEISELQRLDMNHLKYMQLMKRM